MDEPPASNNQIAMLFTLVTVGRFVVVFLAGIKLLRKVTPVKPNFFSTDVMTDLSALGICQYLTSN